MSDWHVLDLPADPVPGDSAGTRDLANRLLREAELAESNTSRLRAIAAGRGDLRMEGDFAPKFRQVLGELPDELIKLGRAYRGAGEALSAFAGSLEDIKTRASGALRKGTDAYASYQGAVREVRALLPPDRQYAVASGLSLNQHTIDAATVGLDEGLRQQIRYAVQRARFAQDDRDRARRLAQDAARMRGEAENQCVKRIHDALDDSGIKNRSWLQKAWHTVTEHVTWDDFVDFCSLAATVLTVVALIATGPFAAVLVAIALALSVFVFANTLVDFVRGRASLFDVLNEGIGILPAGKVAKLVAKLRGTTKAVVPAGKLVKGAIRVGAKSLREAVVSVRKNAIPLARKVLCRDPIDVATGAMVLAQTDLTLPGVLPLTLERVHLSDYRSGGWFGGSWMSTLDQRLELDPRGILFAAADGSILVYPDPGDGPVLPEEGPRRPLSRAGDEFVVTDPATGHTLHFAAAGPIATTLNLVGFGDRNGNRVDVAWRDGAPAELRHIGGQTVLVETAAGRITALHLPDAGVTVVRFGYDGTGRLTEVYNSSGRPLRFEYDLDGRIVAWHDRIGTSYRYTYDAHGRCVHTSGSDGCLDGDLDYGVDGDRTVVTDSLGHAVTYHLNDAAQVVREVDPLGHTVTSEWDRYDRLLSRTDALGRTTAYRYDEHGNVVEVLRPDGSVLTAEYDGPGQAVTVVDATGARWLQTYDRNGNRTGVTDPAGATTLSRFSERGHLTAVTDALGRTRLIETDAAGLPVAMTEPGGATTRWSRDAFGRIVRITDPLGLTAEAGWTVEGNPAWWTGPSGGTERWSYDAEGNEIEHTDPLGGLTRTEVGHFDLPVARRVDGGAGLAFSYDTELRLVAVTDALGRMWRYDYDAAGNRVAETDFDGRRTGYLFDPANQLVARETGPGTRVELERDLLGRVVRQDQAEFAYDAEGRLLLAAGPDGRVEFERDAAGRVLAETVDGRTVHSRYDLLGRRTRRVTPGGTVSEWEYAADNSTLTLRTAGREVTFGYDAAGREVSRRLGDAVLAQTWDAAARLSAQSLTTRGSRMVQHRSFTYRSDDLVTAVDDHLDGSRRLTLDPGGRVTAVDAGDRSERYAYDPAGALVPAADGARHEYDARGRVVLRQQRVHSAKPRTWHYTWAADDRLTGVRTPDGQEWRYRYDPLGRRVAKQRLADGAVAEETIFVWDGPVLAEQVRTDFTGDGEAGRRTTVWDFEPDGFRPVTQHEVDEAFYAIVTDLVGTPTELVTADGEVAWRARQSLWGVPDGRPGQVACPLAFPGQYRDDESGLHYNFYRYYDPGTARYQSPDPIGLAGGVHPYGYVRNPTAWSDPYGLAPCKLTFPHTSDEMSRLLGQDPIKTGLTPDGTPRVTWEVNPTKRIRMESHPDGLSPGDPGFNPRHHGVHFHVTIRLDTTLSWNNPGNVRKLHPPGWTPGSGSGFLPGELIP
ncbi:RHS repeat-associated core domain-containing protein [Actinoplanes sp. NPDC049265]|uniref:RHS repeat-associated core domain-containing protein n=1 Tax=Actinoplanes sp. NPDC049265 TaxID=3363902 RepID=UPI00371BB5F3